MKGCMPWINFKVNVMKGVTHFEMNPWRSLHKHPKNEIYVLNTCMLNLSIRPCLKLFIAILNIINIVSYTVQNVCP